MVRDRLHKAQAKECLIVLVYCILSLFNCTVYQQTDTQSALMSSMASHLIF